MPHRHLSVCVAIDFEGGAAARSESLVIMGALAPVTAV